MKKHLSRLFLVIVALTEAFMTVSLLDSAISFGYDCIVHERWSRTTRMFNYIHLNITYGMWTVTSFIMGLVMAYVTIITAVAVFKNWKYY